ncbi:hypothetical protein H8356DRAFT_1320999 [Neocallimastix lanati (nom. inval.)]|nr:hypothetical protein H8356DRAFT_1320999 [Neocallimastix sp. JGI-2020a]
MTTTIYNSKNGNVNPKTRHIDLRYHRIIELTKEGKIKFEYVNIKLMGEC